MKVIVINGPMGVGKTTVGKYIADSNPGTAFIDGDWCLDIHPFVGNREIRAMAVDNILHLIANYKKCSACKMIVLVWLMDDPDVRKDISDGITSLGLELKSVTLMCSEEELKRRWNADTSCEWRTDEWLKVSLGSLEDFAALDKLIDTSTMTVKQIADRILGEDE